MESKIKDGTTGFKDGVGKQIELNPTDAQVKWIKPFRFKFY